MAEPSKRRGNANLDAVRSVERALLLLEQLAAGRGVNLSQLARETRLSVSTCHRLLTTLQGRGFVLYDRTSWQWHVGHRALAVGASFAQARDLVGLARPIMIRAARQSGGQVVNLGVTSGADVAFLHRVDPSLAKTSCGPVVSSIPVHCSSIGKAILAGLQEREVRDLIEQEGLPSRTTKSITHAKQLFADLKHSQRRGFAIDDEENTVGLRCVAAPIFDEFCRPAAAVSIAAPVERLNGEQIAAFGGIVRAAANDITKAYGGSLPVSH
jgi:IclR family acetate operon transcriptional repressor